MALMGHHRGPRLWAWDNFFAPLGYSPFITVPNDPGFQVFQKKVMKKVITHNLKTLSVYSSIQSMFCHLFSLFTFDFNHVLSFPGSACYYAEVLGGGS